MISGSHVSSSHHTAMLPREPCDEICRSYSTVQYERRTGLRSGSLSWFVAASKMFPRAVVKRNIEKCLNSDSLLVVTELKISH